MGGGGCCNCPAHLQQGFCVLLCPQSQFSPIFILSIPLLLFLLQQVRTSLLDIVFSHTKKKPSERLTEIDLTNERVKVWITVVLCFHPNIGGVSRSPWTCRFPHHMLSLFAIFIPNKIVPYEYLIEKKTPYGPPSLHSLRSRNFKNFFNKPLKCFEKRFIKTLLMDWFVSFYSFLFFLLCLVSFLFFLIYFDSLFFFSFFLTFFLSWNIYHSP